MSSQLPVLKRRPPTRALPQACDFQGVGRQLVLASLALLSLHGSGLRLEALGLLGQAPEGEHEAEDNKATDDYRDEVMAKLDVLAAKVDAMSAK